MLNQLYRTQLGQLVLLAAADAFRNMDQRLIEELGLGGLDNETVAKIKSITTDKIAYLPVFKGSLGHLKIDPNGLRLFLGLADIKVTEDELINAAIRGGMRLYMLETLKGISRRDYEARMKRMNMPEFPRGRLGALTEEQELLVVRTWQKLEHIRDPLLRYVTLHEQTGVCLAQSFSLLNTLT